MKLAMQLENQMWTHLRMGILKRVDWSLSVEIESPQQGEMEQAMENLRVMVSPQFRRMWDDHQQDRLLGHFQAFAVAVMLSQIQRSSICQEARGKNETAVRVSLT